MENYKNKLRLNVIPKHVAIIMDGNGRWAEKNNLPRSEGHKKGAEIIESLMDSAIDLGIKAVSLYAFSVENWSRPKLEVVTLWNLLEKFFNNKLELLKKKGVKIVHSGSLKKLPPSTKKAIKSVIKETEKNRAITLNFCINYGGRQEIVEAVNKWLEKRNNNDKMSLKKMEKFLYTAKLPDVDLLIRTSGEYRISNFLLWQIAYTELVFTDVLWPDFSPLHLYKAVYDYQQRDRRFGGI